jgi:phosphoglucosamine mutase
VRSGRLKGGAVVGTLMSNLGLERHLAGKHIGFHRSNVGDRYVVEKMRSAGCNLGGEPSGHLVLADYATTGDGIIAALQVLAAIVETGKRASEVCQVFAAVPQRMRNIRIARGRPLETKRVEQAIAAGEMRLGPGGRLVIRRSGTEPVLRIMAEGENEDLLENVIDEICEAILSVPRGSDEQHPDRINLKDREIATGTPMSTKARSRSRVEDLVPAVGLSPALSPSATPSE